MGTEAEFNKVIRLRIQTQRRITGPLTCRDELVLMVEANKGDPDEEVALQAMEFIRRSLRDKCIETFVRNTATGDRVDMIIMAV